MTVFAPAEGIERLAQTVGASFEFRHVDFSTRTSVSRLKTSWSQIGSWLDDLPSLEPFEHVICDNLPEILTVAPDAALSAQFFWHEVLDGVAKDYQSLCRALLREVRPTIYGCSVFSMPHVRQNLGYLPVGMAINPQLVAIKDEDPAQKTGLLISCGSTTDALAEFKEIAALFNSAKPECISKVYLDPQLVPDESADWIVRADFGREMFRSLGAAICRPGLGLVSDLLALRIVPIPLFEAGNLEMAHNAAIIRSLSTGSRWTNDVFALNRIQIEDFLATQFQ